MTQVDPAAVGYVGAVFDGRYVHFVPFGASRGKAMRYDTKAEFTSRSSWSQFELTSLDSSFTNFRMGAFDGRYVTFVQYSDHVVRYDTLGSYTNPSSWSHFGLRTAGLHVNGFEGAVFTGQFLYLIPWIPSLNQRWALRFDAKTPPSLPTLPAHHGSFY